MNLFEKYTYQQKNIALLLVSILLFAVSYKRSFSKTLETHRYINELDLKIEEGKESELKVKALQKEMDLLNNLLGKENVSIEEIQQGFLNFFNKFKNDLNVNKIDEVMIFEHPDFKINTFKIDLKGGFLSALKFIYQFEKLFNNARLIHTHFEVINKENNQNELITTIILQNYAQKN